MVGVLLKMLSRQTMNKIAGHKKKRGRKEDAFNALCKRMAK